MKKLLAAALLSVAVAPAFAADSGFYAGVDVGSGRIRVSNCAGCTSSKNNDTVGGVLLGYQYNKNFAVEAKYTGTGKWEPSPAGTGDIKSDAFALVAVGIAPINDSFSLYGKLGVASNKTKVSGALAATNQDTSRTKETYGVGAQYNATPTVGVRLGYDHYRGQVDSKAGGTNADADSDIWTVGVVFKF